MSEVGISHWKLCSEPFMQQPIARPPTKCKLCCKYKAISFF